MKTFLLSTVLLFSFTIRAQDKLAPGVISTSTTSEYGLTFLTDSSICFSRFDGVPILMISEYKDGQWTAPVKASFSGEYGDEYPRFNRQTNQLFFASKRPSDETGAKSANDLWFIQLVNNEWTEAIHLGDNFSRDGIDSGGDSFGHSIFFHSDRRGSGIKDVDIFCIPSGNPKDSAVFLPINSNAVDGEPFIFDNGNAMLFMSAGHNAIGNSDIFLSIKKDGIWQKPTSVDTAGLVNTHEWEYSPTLSNDLKTLYFTRYTVEGLADIYTVKVEQLSNKLLMEIALRYGSKND